MFQVWRKKRHVVILLIAAVVIIAFVYRINQINKIIRYKILDNAVLESYNSWKYTEPVSNVNNDTKITLNSRITKSKKYKFATNELYKMSDFITVDNIVEFMPDKSTSDNPMEPSLLFNKKLQIYFALWRHHDSTYYNELVFGIYDNKLQTKLINPEILLKINKNKFTRKCNESPRLFYFDPNNETKIGFTLECDKKIALTNFIQLNDKNINYNLSKLIQVMKNVIANKELEFNFCNVNNDINIWNHRRKHKNWMLLNYDNQLHFVERISPLEIIRCSDIYCANKCNLIYSEIITDNTIYFDNSHDVLRGGANMIKIPNHSINDILQFQLKNNNKIKSIDYYLSFGHSNTMKLIPTWTDYGLYEIIIIILKIVQYKENNTPISFQIIHISEPITFKMNSLSDNVRYKMAFLEQSAKGISKWFINETFDELHLTVQMRNIRDWFHSWKIVSIQLIGMRDYIRYGLIHSFNEFYISNGWKKRWVDNYKQYYNKYEYKSENHKYKYLWVILLVIIIIVFLFRWLLQKHYLKFNAYKI